MVQHPKILSNLLVSYVMHRHLQTRFNYTFLLPWYVYMFRLLYCHHHFYAWLLHVSFSIHISFAKIIIQTYHSYLLFVLHFDTCNSHGPAEPNSLRKDAQCRGLHGPPNFTILPGPARRAFCPSPKFIFLYVSHTPSMPDFLLFPPEWSPIYLRPALTLYH
jgi:hypothetical protein